MKIIQADFGKSARDNKLNAKVTKALKKIGEDYSDNAEGSYILLCDIDGTLVISSDLDLAAFNFVLDTVKTNVLYSATFPEDVL
jgi:hypothetical protein